MKGLNVVYVMRKADSDLSETGPSSEKKETVFIKLLDTKPASATRSQIDFEVPPNQTRKLKWLTDKDNPRGFYWTAANYTWTFYVVIGDVNLNIVEVMLRRIAKDGKSIKSYKGSGDVIYSLANQGVQKGTITWNDETQNPEEREPEDRLELIFIVKNTASSSSTVTLGSDSQDNLVEEKEEIQQEQEGLSKPETHTLSSSEAHLQNLTESFANERKKSTKSSWLWPWFALSIVISFVAFILVYVIAINNLPISSSNPESSNFENITITPNGEQDSNNFNDKFRTVLILSITAAIIPAIIFAVANNLKVQQQNNELSSLSIKIRETRSRIAVLRQKQAMNLRIWEQRRKETVETKEELQSRVDELKNKIKNLESLEDRIEKIEIEKLEARLNELEKPRTSKEGETKKGGETNEGTPPSPSDTAATAAPEKSYPSPSDTDRGEIQIKVKSSSPPTRQFRGEDNAIGGDPKKWWSSDFDTKTERYPWIEISLGDTPQTVHGIGVQWAKYGIEYAEFARRENDPEVSIEVMDDPEKVFRYFRRGLTDVLERYNFPQEVKAENLRITIRAPKISISDIKAFSKPGTGTEAVTTRTPSEPSGSGTVHQSKGESKEEGKNGREKRETV